MSTKPRSIIGLAVLAALLAACGSKPAEPAKTRCRGAQPRPSTPTPRRCVNVYNWSDYIEPTVIEAFEKDTGIKVNYEVMDSNELLETKLLAGRTGYDVVVPSASFLARQIKAGIYQKLDKSKLPNYKNLDADITKRLEVFDPGNEYAVNYMWGTSGVGYNEAKIKEAMPDAPVDSFAMFWDPKVASEVRQVRRLGARCAQRGRRHRADLPGQGCQQREAGRPEGRREGADVGASVHPPDQLLEVHRGPGQRRDLPGAGLVG